MDSISGYTITIRQTEPRRGVLVVEGLGDIDEAHKVFSALRKGIIATNLNLSTGVRVNPSLIVLSNPDDQFPQDIMAPFVCHQGRDRRRVILTAGVPYFQVNRIRERLWQSLEVGFHRESVNTALADERVELACQLFVDSHFEASDEARFLSLIGILEVLKDSGEVSETARALIGQWDKEAKMLDREEANSIRGGLKYLQTVSIGRGIRYLVDRHLGADKAREASKLYHLRSQLVHDGRKPESFSKVVREAEALTKDLLSSILMRGAV